MKTSSEGGTQGKKKDGHKQNERSLACISTRSFSPVTFKRAPRTRKIESTVASVKSFRGNQSNEEEEALKISKAETAMDVCSVRVASIQRIVRSHHMYLYDATHE